jgi:hypothetical protein
MNFESLNYFLSFKIIGKTINKRHTVSGLKPAHGLRCAGKNGPWVAAWWPATRGRSEGRLGHGLVPRPSRGGGLRRAETRRVPCSHRARWRGDTFDGGAVGAGRQRGAAGEHRWGLFTVFKHRSAISPCSYEIYG